MCDETKTEVKTSTRAYPDNWNPAPPFEIGNKLGLKHGLRAVERHTLSELEIDPQYFLDIKIEPHDMNALVEVLDMVVVFAESIMALIVKTDNAAPQIFVSDYADVAQKASMVRESIRSRTIEPTRKIKRYTEDSADVLWAEANSRLNLLMMAMNQCHGILSSREIERKGAMERDAKRNKWNVATWIRPYKSLLISITCTVENMAMLMTHWSKELGKPPIDSLGVRVRNA